MGKSIDKSGVVCYNDCKGSSRRESVAPPTYWDDGSLAEYEMTRLILCELAEIGLFFYPSGAKK